MLKPSATFSAEKWRIHLRNTKQITRQPLGHFFVSFTWQLHYDTLQLLVPPLDLLHFLPLNKHLYNKPSVPQSKKKYYRNVTLEVKSALPHDTIINLNSYALLIRPAHQLYPSSYVGGHFSGTSIRHCHCCSCKPLLLRLTKGLHYPPIISIFCKAIFFARLVKIYSLLL